MPTAEEAAAANAAYMAAQRSGVPIPVGMDPATYLQMGPSAVQQQQYAAANSLNGINPAALANVPLSQIAAQYGPGVAARVSQYYIENPTPRYQETVKAYEQQHFNTIGGVTPVSNPQYRISPVNPMNSAASIAAEVGRVGGVVDPNVGKLARSEGYTGPIRSPIGPSPTETPPSGLSFSEFIAWKQSAYETELKKYTAAGSNDLSTYNNLISKGKELGTLNIIGNFIGAAQQTNDQIQKNQNSQNVGDAGLGPAPVAPSFFSNVSTFFKETPVLSTFYGLGYSYGGSKNLSNWMESAPILSTIFLGGAIFEGRQDVIGQQNQANIIFQDYKDRGLITDKGFTGTQGQFANLVSSQNLAGVKAINQETLEAPYFGNQVIPWTMPLASWAIGASSVVKGAGDTIIKSADSVMPWASPATRVVVGVGEGIVSLLPFAAMAIPAAEWAVKNPVSVTMGIVPGQAAQVQTMATQAKEDPFRFGGNIAGLVVAGKVAGDIYESFPYRVRYGRFDIPIETPEGMPKTEAWTGGYSKVLESVRENGVEVFNRAASGEPAVYRLQSGESPIQYTATWKGLYFDVKGQMKIMGRTIVTGSPYEGKIPLAGVGYEAGTRTGIWFGPESARAFGRSIESRVSGAINFLGESSPEMATLKLQAAEAFLPAQDLDVVRSIVALRETTQRYPGLITVKEPYGEVTPVSMKPETYQAIREYMNAHAEDMRAYGSLVGRSYHGEFGRASLGDVDALLKSSTAQTHAEAMWDIYLEREFGQGAYQISRTERTFSTLTEGGKPKTITQIKLEATDPAGNLLSKLETVPSQITENRITGTTPAGAHALDLHPISNLKYSRIIPGTDVATIPIEDLIWGKQTIGNPPIGTIVISRSGASEVIVEMGGRAKDFFDTYAFAKTAAADAYLNPRVALSDAIRLEQSSNILGEKIGITAKTEPTIENFMREMRDPFTTREIISAKMNKLMGAASTRFHSGIPTPDYYIYNNMEPLTDNFIGKASFSLPIAASKFGGYYTARSNEPTPSYYLQPVTTPGYRPIISASEYNPPYEPSTYSIKEAPYSPSSDYTPSLYNPNIPPYTPNTPLYMPSYDLPPYTPSIPPYSPPFNPPQYTPRTPPYNPPTLIPPYNPPPFTPPPYTPPDIPPYNPPPYIPPPTIPPENPPPLIPPYIPPLIIRKDESRIDWQMSKRRKHPARFLELFSFEMGTDTPVPKRFGLGGVNAKALGRQPARFLELFSLEEGTTSAVPKRFGKGGVNTKAMKGNPEARFIPGYKGYAGKLLAPEDVAPQGLFDIVGKGYRRGRKRTVWENMIS